MDPRMGYSGASSCPHIKEAFDEDGHLLDEKIADRMEDMAKSLVETAEYLKSRR